MRVYKGLGGLRKILKGVFSNKNMAKRGGSFLEESIAVLLQKAGFNTKLNAWVEGYEVDVLASKGSYKMAIECKHYEHSHLTIRNIIHQWASKNNILKVDKIIVVIAGQTPSKEDYKLAKDLGIVLVDDSIIHHLNSLTDINKLREELNNVVVFDNELYKQKQIKKIRIISSVSSISIFVLIISYFFLRNIFYIIAGVIGYMLFLFLLITISPKKK